MKSGSNTVRGALTDANLELKRLWLAELVTQARDGELIDADRYPTTMEGFRIYADESHGLKKISSPKILNKKQSPQRASLIDEIESYLGQLRAFKSAKNRPPKKLSLTAQVCRLKQKNADLEYLVGRLLSQVAALLDSNRRLDTAHRDIEKTKRLTNDTVKVLNKKIIELGGSLVKGVKKID